MDRIMRLGLTAALLGAGTTVAYAGYTNPREVRIYEQNNNFIRASGAMNHARWGSGDQFIGCTTYYVANGSHANWMSCEARSSTHWRRRYCFSYDPGLIEAAKSIAPGSYVEFSMQYSTCKTLTVGASSTDL